MYETGKDLRSHYRETSTGGLAKSIAEINIIMQICSKIEEEIYGKQFNRKNKEYIVNIIDNGYDGEGIAKIDNFTIFVPTAIKGEKCKILIVKVCPTYAYGK